MSWANTLGLGTIINKEATRRIKDGKKLVAEALAARTDYTEKRNEYIGMMKDEDGDPARLFLVGPLRSSLEAYPGSIVKLFAALDLRLKQGSAESLRAAKHTRVISLVIGLIALAVADEVRKLAGRTTNLPPKSR